MNPDFSKPDWVAQRSEHSLEANQILQVNVTFNTVFEADVQVEAGERFHLNNILHHGITPTAR